MSLRKPQTPIINWGNPLTKGLVLDTSLSEGGGMITTEDALSAPSTFVGTPTWIKNQGGVGVQFDNASTDRITFVTKASQNNLEKVSVQTIAIQKSGMSNGGRLFHKGVTGIKSNRFYQHGEIDAGHMYFATDWTGEQGAWRFSAGAPSAGVIHNIVSTYNGSSATNDPVLYLNGVSMGVTEVVGPSGTRGTDSAILYVGGGNSASASWSGTIYLTRMWNRILSPTEVWALYQNPYQIYSRPKFMYMNSIAAAELTTQASTMLMMGV